MISIIVQIVQFARFVPFHQEDHFMTAKQKIHQAHLNEWAARFTDQKTSGLTVRQWCEQNHLSIHKYNYWKHLLKEEVVDQILPDIVPLPVAAPAMPAVPTLAKNDGSSQTAVNRIYNPDRANRTNRATFTNPNVKLCIDGVAIEIDPSVPEEFLRTLIRAVHYA